MVFKGKLHLVERTVTVLLFKLLRLIFTTIQSLYWQLNGTAEKLREARDPKNYDRCAQVLDIRLFHKFCELQNTSFEEFICTHNRFENPQYIIDNDDISLLLINDKNAIFVQAMEKGMQLWKAEVNPFIRLAQMYYGKTLFVIPLEAFNRLADSVGDPPKVIFLFNTARCGSTLLNQILESTGRCVAVSEPDAPNIIAMKYRNEGDSPELRQLARSVVRLECRPFKSFQPPPLAYMLKLTAPSGIALPFLHKIYPDSVCLFMYRDYIKVAKSVYRLHYVWPSVCLTYMLGSLSGSLTAKVIDSMGYSGKDYKVRLTNDFTFGVLLSAVVMKEFLDFRKNGIDIQAVRYEDLVARPIECCQQILEYCGLPVSLAELAVKGLERDSQRNTPLAKSNIGHLREPSLTPESKKDINKLLRDYGLPTLDEECVIEGTMTYKKQ